ncbi:MAG: hypothetical protein ACKVP3_03140 [Hyphomicrobiaceae bacterium]
MIADAAFNILTRCAIAPGAEYFSLTSVQIDALTEQADLYGYRKHKNLEGATARHFHAFLTRQIKGEWE